MFAQAFTRRAKNKNISRFASRRFHTLAMSLADDESATTPSNSQKSQIGYLRSEVYVYEEIYKHSTSNASNATDISFSS